jgi:riboflavin biosynthesis pyrimidine reductase
VAGAPARAEALRAAGAEIETVGGEPGLAPALARLATRGFSSVVVEGGPRLHRAFWEAGLVDRLEMFITPHRLGPDGLDWLPVAQLAERTWSRVSGRNVGGDILIEAYVHRPD